MQVTETRIKITGIIQLVKENKKKKENLFKVTRTMWLRINSCFENTSHFIESEERGDIT